jgi:hypothetical protein
MQIIRQTFNAMTRWLQPPAPEKLFKLTPRHRKRFLVSHDHKILYCPIEKNSCTFFKRLLIMQSQYADQFLASEQQIHSFLNQSGVFRPDTSAPFVSDEYLRFVVFREPIGRIVSAYMNKFVRSRRYKIALKVTEDYRNRNGQRYHERRLLNFTEFVEHICLQADRKMDVHWRPQCDFVRDEIDLFQYQVTLERVPEFTAILSRRMGVELDTSKTPNQNFYKTYPAGMDLHVTAPEDLRKLEHVPDMNSLLTPELRAKLEDRYAQDIVLYQNCLESKWPRESNA